MSSDTIHIYLYNLLKLFRIWLLTPFSKTYTLQQTNWKTTTYGFKTSRIQQVFVSSSQFALNIYDTIRKRELMPSNLDTFLPLDSRWRLTGRRPRGGECRRRTRSPWKSSPRLRSNFTQQDLVKLLNWFWAGTNFLFQRNSLEQRKSFVRGRPEHSQFRFI